MARIDNAVPSRILGLDPGLLRTGFGAIGTHGRHRAEALGCGVIRPASSLPMAQRLLQIFNDVSELVAQYQPSLVAIETVFVNSNPRSTLALGQARGAAFAALARAGCEVVEITPLSIKKAVVGTGRASKEQVQAMVCQLLKLPQAPASADAADALACALACWQSQSPMALASAASRSPRGAA